MPGLGKSGTSRMRPRRSSTLETVTVVWALQLRLVAPAAPGESRPMHHAAAMEAFPDLTRKRRRDGSTTESHRSWIAVEIPCQSVRQLRNWPRWIRPPHLPAIAEWCAPSADDVL